MSRSTPSRRDTHTSHRPVALWQATTDAAAWYVAPPSVEYSSDTSARHTRTSSVIVHVTNCVFATESEDDSSQYSPPFGDRTLTCGAAVSAIVSSAGVDVRLLQRPVTTSL